jgi:hypothetical protein
VLTGSRSRGGGSRAPAPLRLHQRLKLGACLPPISDPLLRRRRRYCPCQVRVQCPEVEGNEKLIGQLLEVEVATLRDTVRRAGRRLFLSREGGRLCAVARSRGRG